jgi:hypothetical protein
MKVKALFSGHNGMRSYEAGAILDGPPDHVRRLLFNNAGTPEDAEAKAFVKERDHMSDKLVKASPDFNQSIREYVADNDTGGPSNKKRGVAKKAAKRGKRK